jgi:hypothetical protein
LAAPLLKPVALNIDCRLYGVDARQTENAADILGVDAEMSDGADQAID